MKKNQKTIQLSFLEDFPSLAEGIFSLMDISKNKLKKFPSYKKKLSHPVKSQETFELPLDLINDNRISPFYEGDSIEVLYEDDIFLVLAKPYKIHSHPLSYCEKDNILSFIRDKLAARGLDVNRSNYDRGLLYRLDFETSGCLIYIKNEITHKKLRENFSTIVREKTYYAVVDGECKLCGEFTHYLESWGPKGSMMRVSETDFRKSEKQGKRASISITPIDYNKKQNLSLVRIKLYEGHRHQIRIQLKALGHSILGDPIYGIRDAARMFLHCGQYTLELDGNEYIFTDPDFKLLFNFFSFNCQS